ncbi:THO complex subunit 7-like protein, partial [Nibea albiflora]
FTQYQRMLGTLAQCEFSMGKTLMVYDMNLREMENYETIYTNIEYDALAKVIQQHPDRHETLKQLEALDKELQQLSHIKENVDAKLELRKKQFHVLLSTIQELQQTLENDEKSDNEDNNQESPAENGE